MEIFKDFSISAAIAGFVTILVGFTGAAVIVFQAAQTLGASPPEIGSWLWALGLGMGLTSIILSLRYRVPIVTIAGLLAMAISQASHRTTHWQVK